MLFKDQHFVVMAFQQLRTGGEETAASGKDSASAVEQPQTVIFQALVIGEVPAPAGAYMTSYCLSREINPLRCPNYFIKVIYPCPAQAMVARRAILCNATPQHCRMVTIAVHGIVDIAPKASEQEIALLPLPGHDTQHS